METGSLLAAVARLIEFLDGDIEVNNRERETRVSYAIL